MIDGGWMDGLIDEKQPIRFDLSIYRRFIDLSIRFIDRFIQ